MTDEKKPFDPVVPVEGEPQTDSTIDTGSGLSVSKNNNTKIIMIVVSIVSSIVIYFMLFSGGKKEDVVDNRNIVRSDSNVGGISSSDRNIVDNLDNISNLNRSDDLSNNGFNVDGNTIGQGALELPTIPTLPDSVKNNIEDEIEEVRNVNNKENVFTKEEVDKLINEKLKKFEDEIKKAKNESERLAKEIERQKILEEEENKKKKLSSSIIPNTLTLPLDSATDESKVDPKSPEGIMLAEEKKRQAEEEKQIQIAQRSRVIEERKGASMFKMQGGGGGDTSLVDQNSIIITSKDSLMNVADSEVQVKTTKAADMSRMILQGKIINAVLETSINTDVQSQVRAIVTRDVYSESEKNILIPKGSKLIGSFRADNLSPSNPRLSISWSRIIRVDGLNISISSNTADDLGRGGVAGDLDNKYAQAIQNSILSSVVSVGGALLVEKISGSVGISNTTNGNSSTTTSGKASDYAIVDAVQSFSDDMEDLVDKLKTESPTLRVAQGTRLNVVVNQDLSLPIFKQNK